MMILNAAPRLPRGGYLASLLERDESATRREVGANDVAPPVTARSVMPGDQPDYGGVLSRALGPRPELHGFRKVASILGPALMAATGNQAGASQMIEMLNAPRQRWDDQNREAMLTQAKWGREDRQAEAKRNEPQFFSGNEDRVRFDPATGASTRIYDAPQDFEDYAASGGHEPGSPEYFKAVEDYVLRGNGPTAFQFDKDLEVLRNAQRITLEGARQRNRLDLRGVPTYRDTHPIPKAPRAAARPTATGPKGEKLEYDGKAWVPVG